MARKIKLTKGKFATVDDEDFEWLSRWNWFAAKVGKMTYAARENSDGTLVYMHDEVMQKSLDPTYRGDQGIFPLN